MNKQITPTKHSVISMILYIQMYFILSQSGQKLFSSCLFSHCYTNLFHVSQHLLLFSSEMAV